MTDSVSELRTKLAADAAEKSAEIAKFDIDAEFAFVSYVLTKVQSDEHDEPVPAQIEAAAYELMPQFGRSTVRDAREVAKMIALLDEAYLARGRQNTFGDAPGETAKDELEAHLRIYHQTIRGQAFPVQTAARLEGLFAPFEERLARKHGIGPIKAAAVIKHIAYQLNDHHAAFHAGAKELLQERERLMQVKERSEEETMALAKLEDRAKRWWDEYPDRWPAAPQDILRRVPGLTPEEWTAMVMLFGYDPAIRAKALAFVTVQDRPMFMLSRERVVLSHLSSALDAVFSFFDEAVRDDPELRDEYGLHVSRWMEGQAELCSQRIFPKAVILREACYPDPDAEGAEASADQVIVWPPFLVVIEAKGKALKRRSLRGDLARLKTDVKKNIADAFSQAERVSRALEKFPTLRLKEKATGREIMVEKAKLHRVFPISVTLYHFAGLATQLGAVKPLGLFRKDSYPWSVSLGDFDVITQFVGHPDAFLHYLERRLEIQQSNVDISGDELDLFGHYLDARLHPDMYWRHRELQGHPGPVRISISGGSEKFDQFYNAKFFGVASAVEIKLDVPDVIGRILGNLRAYPDAGARWTAFALLGLSQPALNHLAKKLGDLFDPRITGTIPRVTFRDGEVIVVAMGNRGLPLDRFNQTLMFRTMLEKYRTKAPKAIGLGINLFSGPQIVAGAIWEEGEWQHEPPMEELLAKDSQRKIVRSMTGALPGRNDKCVCGSGKKFKRCCLDRVKFV